MKQFAFASRAVAALVLTTAISAFAGAASAEFNGVTAGAEFSPYNAGAVTDAYESFVMSKAPAPASSVADGGYGSQGFHHGLPETSAVPAVEPVAGGADAMRDASIFTYTPDADYGSRDIEHWLPNYNQAD